MTLPEFPSERSPSGVASPWFARVASGLLEAGATREALTVCLDGTRVFPRYATGRLMLGKCYEALGWHVEAMLEYRRVSEAFPDNLVVRDLLRGVEDREQKDFEVFAEERLKHLQATKDRMTFEDYIGAGANLSWPLPAVTEAEPEEMKAAPLLGEEEPVQTAPVGSESEPVAEAMSEGPQPQPPAEEMAAPTPQLPVPEIQPPPAEQRKTSGRIVTATLAEIYASQGEYDEAIEAYRALIQQRPGSAGRYQRRLAELEELKQHHQREPEEGEQRTPG